MQHIIAIPPPIRHMFELMTMVGLNRPQGRRLRRRYRREQAEAIMSREAMRAFVDKWSK